MHHGVEITDPAIVAAATLSHRYISDRQLPDKAIDLIDEAGSLIRMEIDSKPEVLDKLDRRIRATAFVWPWPAQMRRCSSDAPPMSRRNSRYIAKRSDCPFSTCRSAIAKAKGSSRQPHHSDLAHALMRDAT